MCGHSPRSSKRGEEIPETLLNIPLLNREAGEKSPSFRFLDFKQDRACAPRAGPVDLGLSNRSKSVP